MHQKFSYLHCLFINHWESQLDKGCGYSLGRGGGGGGQEKEKDLKKLLKMTC